MVVSTAASSGYQDFSGDLPQSAIVADHRVEEQKGFARYRFVWRSARKPRGPPDFRDSGFSGYEGAKGDLKNHG
jgi:hypothetical protein